MVDSKQPAMFGKMEMAIGAVGVVAAAGVFLGMFQVEEEQSKAAFAAELNGHVARVERSVDQLSFYLRSLQDMNEMVGALTRGDFSVRAAQAQKEQPEIREVMYIPKLAGSDRAAVEQAARRDGLDEFSIHDANGEKLGERAAYRPELLVEPAPEATRFGLDHAEDAPFLAAAAEATRTGAPALLPTEQAEEAALVFPVYRPESPTFVEVGRKASVQGHVVLRFAVPTLLARSLAGVSMDEVDLQIVDKEKRQLLAGASGVRNDKALLARPVAFPGDRWELRGAPTRAYLAARHGAAPFLGLGAVLFVSGFLVFAFRQQRLQKAKVEQQVEERTAELAARTRDMRRVLDHVDAALMTVDYEGKMASEASAALERWFGTREGAGDVVAYLGRSAPTTAEYIGLGLEQLKDDFMPPEVTLAQMPQRLSKGDHTYEIEYIPFEDEVGPKLLMVASDITARIEAELAQARQRQLLRIFDRILEDREGFLDFFADTGRLVADLVESKESDPTLVARHLHTVKGNCGFFDLDTVAGICHRIEDRLAEDGGLPTAEELLELAHEWRQVSDDLGRFIGEDDARAIQVSEEEYEQVLQAVLAEQDPGQIHALIQGWRDERVAVQFARIAGRATKLASRLGKGELVVEQAHHDLRLPREPLLPFWSNLVHVIRNAVDHGLESPDERAAAGKSAQPKLRLTARSDEQGVHVEVADDGRGIDFDKLIAKAQANGTKFEHPEDLLFVDGLSSRDTASDTSGRGVGMAAVKASVEDLGGHIDVHTIAGKGTRFRFEFPKLDEPESVRRPRPAARA